MAWTVNLASYQGPLDLLLDLLSRHELDIAEVAVAQVTAQYIAYLDSLPPEDLELCSEFLVMGATLLALKARLLLPEPETKGETAVAAEELEEPPERLMERLACYKRFRDAASSLEKLAIRRADYWSRGIDSETYQMVMGQINPLSGITLDDLVLALERVGRRRDETVTVDPPRAEINIMKLRAGIRRYLQLHKRVSLLELLGGAMNDPRLLVTGLLVILMLSHEGEVRLEQDQLWGPIHVCARALAPEGAVN